MAQLSFIPVDQTEAGSTTILAAVPGERHKIRGAFLLLTGSGTIKFSDGTDDLTGPMSLDTKAGFVLPVSPSEYIRTPANTPLQLITTGGAAKGALVVVSEP
jgi:hypothetical protein